MSESSGSGADRVVRTLRDITRFTDTAARLVARGKGAYDSDEALRLAAEAILHKIGEAVARLPEEFIAVHPEVAWRSMKATRNVVAHKYDHVDYEIIWNALAHRLPAEAARIREILIDAEGG
ncbi:DUF86 domain-containing protein [Mycobacterium malmoense]|uniref:HepT-like ribonuclease domain-containing protein n=1 Tax=Mycobacterium malmoense TaxID=1780 RepID=UPI0009F20593|nr:HepT-like ribonuclease domain-containing protein [Mycobacterium malmoense]QZA15943.1 DUF86 domain-containing protein [Mycobacterium malmoense]UNB92756.1 DUF86 domain-containing protein [Mycobacterium malmoense]